MTRRRKSQPPAPRCCIRAASCRRGSTTFHCTCLRPSLRTSRGRRSAERFAGSAGQVKAVCIKKGMTLVSMESPGMWHQVGFLADAFAVFKRQGLSVDQVSTSETSVTVSLDPQANALEPGHPRWARGGTAYAVPRPTDRPLRVRKPRGAQHSRHPASLGDALQLFAEQRIYMVSQAANDLNITFLVDEDQGDRLVEQLHELLVRRCPRTRRWARAGAHSFGGKQAAAPVKVPNRGGWPTARSCWS